MSEPKTPAAEPATPAAPPVGTRRIAVAPFDPEPTAAAQPEPAAPEEPGAEPTEPQAAPAGEGEPPIEQQPDVTPEQGEATPTEGEEPPPVEGEGEPEPVAHVAEIPPEVPPEPTQPALPPEYVQNLEHYNRIQQMANTDPAFALAYWKAEQRRGHPGAAAQVAALETFIAQQPAPAAAGPVVQSDDAVRAQHAALLKEGKEFEAQQLLISHAANKIIQQQQAEITRLQQTVNNGFAAFQAQEQQKRDQALVRNELAELNKVYPALVKADPTKPFGFAIDPAVKKQMSTVNKNVGETAQVSMRDILETALAQTGRAAEIKQRKAPAAANGKVVATTKTQGRSGGAAPAAPANNGQKLKPAAPVAARPASGTPALQPGFRRMTIG